MRIHQFRTRALALAACSAWIAHTQADLLDAFWIGTEGSWSDPTNWDTNPSVPNNNGDTYHARIDSDDAIVDLDIDILLKQFTLARGRLIVSQTLNTDLLAWNGGTLSGTGTIDVSGLAVVILGEEKRFSKTTVNLSSNTTTTWFEGAIRETDNEGGVFNNSGTFDDKTDDAWTWNAAETPVFNNLAGAVYLKSEGSQTKDFWPAMNNDGLVDVLAGGIWFAGGGTNTGTFLVAEDATLKISDFNQFFPGPVTELLPDSVIESHGTLEFANSFGFGTTEISGTVDAVYLIVNNADTGGDGTPGLTTFASGSTLGANFVGDAVITSGVLSFEDSSGTVNFLGVGETGTGTLLVQSNAILQGSVGIVGNDTDSSGTVIVSGTGANLSFSESFTVGKNGSGMLLVSDGAVVVSNDGFIGAASDGVGTVVIGGMGAAASWELSGSLYLGGDETIASGSAAHLQVDTDGLLQASTGIKVWNNGVIQWNAGSISTASLELIGGGELNLSDESPKVLLLNALEIDTAAGSRIDLSNNQAILDYAADESPLETIRAYLAEARGPLGEWNLDGIGSSSAFAVAMDENNPHKTALGYADAAALGIEEFGGQSLADETAILIGYTYLGDANLDGLVDTADFDLLAANFNGADRHWFTGDFNYDGVTNAMDFNVLATNWGQASMVMTVGTLVPEPWGLSLFAAPAACLRRRIRR